MSKASSGVRLLAASLTWLALLGLAAAASADPAFKDLFEEATAEAGLEFRHWNGMTGARYINENVGGGGALFDFDRDGDLDLFVVQGRLLAKDPEAQPLFPPPAGPLKDRLFRNDLGPEGPRFVDVTSKSRIVGPGYGMGAVSADVDRDGFPDLYVLNWGANQLWRNRGDGTFEDMTERAGVGEQRWSTTATFFDYDRDGWLDLFVGNYLDFRLEKHQPCLAVSGAADYCGPASYPPAVDRLYRNRGDGTFEDVTSRLGMDGVRAAGLGSLAFDVDADGGLELFVANDGMANHLWDFDGSRMEETALLAGCAVNVDGVAEASMGVDAGDIDGDGDEDLFITHLDQETNTLYLNDGGFFDDVSDTAGDALKSFAFTGFGTRLVDLDLDGWLDAVAVNGSVKAVEKLARAGDPYPLHQKNQVYRNVGGRFREVTAALGKAFEPSHVSRGLAAGDVDNDGDIDLVIFNNNGPLRLLLNRTIDRGRGAFIGFDLWDGKSEALGARVGVFTGDRVLWRRFQSGGSFASGQDSRIVVGLGIGKKSDEPAASRQIEKVRVEWLGAGEDQGTVRRSVEQWRDLAVGEYHRLERGGGRAVEEK